jgi:tRNA(Ile2) C34 agmatinyltransferase TiaS
LRRESAGSQEADGRCCIRKEQEKTYICVKYTQKQKREKTIFVTANSYIYMKDWHMRKSTCKSALVKIHL